MNLSLIKVIETIKSFAQQMEKTVRQIKKSSEEYIKVARQEERQREIREKPPVVHFQKQIPKSRNSLRNDPQMNGFPHPQSISDLKNNNERDDKNSQQFSAQVNRIIKNNTEEEEEQKKQDQKKITKSKDSKKLSRKDDDAKDADVKTSNEKTATKPVKLEKPAAIKQVAPQKPKGPLSAYMRFSRVNVQKVKQSYPHLSQTDLVSVTGEMWNRLDEKFKKPFMEEYERDKLRYDAEMLEYYRKYPDQKPKKAKK